VCGRSREALNDDLRAKPDGGEAVLVEAFGQAGLEEIGGASSIRDGNGRSVAAPEHSPNGAAGMAGASGDIADRMALPGEKLDVPREKGTCSTSSTRPPVADGRWAGIGSKDHENGPGVGQVSMLGSGAGSGAS
jgi:hypothetical protein